MALVITMCFIGLLIAVFIFGGIVLYVRGKSLDQIVNVGTVLIVIQFLLYLALDHVKGLPNG